MRHPPLKRSVATAVDASVVAAIVVAPEVPVVDGVEVGALALQVDERRTGVSDGTGQRGAYVTVGSDPPAFARAGHRADARHRPQRSLDRARRAACADLDHPAFG